MTPQMEEELIKGLGEMNGTLKMLVPEVQEIKKNMVSKTEVATVSKDLEDHKKGHITRRGLITSYISIGAALFIAFGRDIFRALASGAKGGTP